MFESLKKALFGFDEAKAIKGKNENEEIGKLIEKNLKEYECNDTNSITNKTARARQLAVYFNCLPKGRLFYYTTEKWEFRFFPATYISALDIKFKGVMKKEIGTMPKGYYPRSSWYDSIAVDNDVMDYLDIHKKEILMDLVEASKQGKTMVDKRLQKLQDNVDKDLNRTSP